MITKRRATGAETKLLVYGDSISQGLMGSHPYMSYVPLISDVIGADYLNLSVGGDLFDKNMIDPSLPFTPTAVIVALGTNDIPFVGDYKKIKKNIEDFFARLREVYPNIPVNVISTIWQTDLERFDTEEERNKYKLFMQIYRKTMKESDKAGCNTIDGLKIMPACSGIFHGSCPSERHGISAVRTESSAFSEILKGFGALELPLEYTNKMTELLGKEEFARYRQALDSARAFGIRVNTLKITTDEFIEELGECIGIGERIPWTSDGFYYDPFDGKGAEQPGKLPFYHAGLYYLQEPSAMYPAEQLDVKPGDKVLDLCAAPGGKSTKLAAKLKGTGLLVANDVSEERVKALIYNLELAGVRNAVVTNEPPGPALAEFFRVF